MSEQRHWSEKLIRFALKRQNKLVGKVPSTVRLAGKNRKARLIICDGNKSDPFASTVATFYLKWDGFNLIEEEGDTGVRNNICIHADTLIDIALGEVHLKEAVAASLIIIDGDRGLYDQAEMERVMEDFLSGELGPIVRGLNAKRR